MVARGEVWWYDDPERGPRPHLILTRTEVVPYLRRVIVVPATRTARGIPTEVELDESDGMREACVLTLDNLLPIPPSLCRDRITKLSPEKMREVCNALWIAMAC